MAFAVNPPCIKHRMFLRALPSNKVHVAPSVKIPPPASIPDPPMLSGTSRTQREGVGQAGPDVQMWHQAGFIRVRSTKVDGAPVVWLGRSRDRHARPLAILRGRLRSEYRSTANDTAVRIISPN